MEEKKKSNEKIITCPKCDTIFTIGYNDAFFYCITCKIHWCTKCFFHPPHGHKCKIDQKWKNNFKQEKKECPKWKVTILKDAGCNTIVCRSPIFKGNTTFCFVCIKVYTGKVRKCPCPEA